MYNILISVNSKLVVNWTTCIFSILQLKFLLKYQVACTLVLYGYNQIKISIGYPPPNILGNAINKLTCIPVYSYITILMDSYTSMLIYLMK